MKLGGPCPCLIVILAMAAGLAAPTSAAAATSAFTIVTRDFYVSQIGPFQPARDPRLSAAIPA